MCVITLCVGLCLWISCGGDDESPTNSGAILEPLPSLRGEYRGVYLYTTGYGTGSPDTTEYLVLWRFSDQNYWIWNADDSGNEMCEPSGEYTLADGVELTQAADGCAGTSGDSDWNPIGAFNLRQPTDSIIMTQIIGTIAREIRLATASSQ